TMLRDLPQELLLHYGLPTAALVLGGLTAMRERADARWHWLAGLAVLAALFAVALWQGRGAAAAHAVAAAPRPPAAPRLLPALARWWRARPGPPAYLGLSRAALIAALALNPLALTALGAGAAHALEAATGRARPLIISEGAGTCRPTADYAALAQLPKGLVL